VLFSQRELSTNCIQFDNQKDTVLLSVLLRGLVNNTFFNFFSRNSPVIRPYVSQTSLIIDILDKYVSLYMRKISKERKYRYKWNMTVNNTIPQRLIMYMQAGVLSNVHWFSKG